MRKRKAPPKPAGSIVPDPIVPQRIWCVHLAALSALWVLALAAYANSFSSGLVLDNRFIIASDSRIQAATVHNVGLIVGRDYWFGTGTTDLYRPLTTLSYLFNYAVLGNGTNPAGYHWVNFVLHALNFTLVYVLALSILGDVHGAVATAAVWAVHPVLTESVTNVVGRADLLAAFGVLAALLCHIQSGRAAGGRRVRWLLGLAVAAALGIFSKESAIVALPVMVLYDLAFGADATWRRRMENYAAAALPCLLYLFLRGQVLAKLPRTLIAFIDNPLVGADFWTARLTAIRVIGKYLGLLLWPGALSADYSYNQVPLFRANNPAALLGVAVCAALATAAVWAFRRNRTVFFFVALFFVALAPVSNVFLHIGTIMAERFLYLPALGFAGCVAVGLRAASPRLPARVAAMLLAAVCAAFAVRTYVRNRDWATEQTLMTSAAEAAPAAWRPHVALTTLLSGSADVAEADKARAILDPLPDVRNSGQPYIALGISYRLYGDHVVEAHPQEAQGWYRKSLDALLRARSIEQEIRRHGAGNTGFVWDKLYLELGRTYLGLSQPQDALAVLRQGRSLTSHPALFFEEMSNGYRAMGDSRQAAVALFGGVLVLLAAHETETSAQLSAKLVDLYRQTDPQSCAVRESGGGRAIDMDCPLVQEDICAAFRDLSRDYAIPRMPVGCPAE